MECFRAQELTMGEQVRDPVALSKGGAAPVCGMPVYIIKEKKSIFITHRGQFYRYLYECMKLQNNAEILMLLLNNG